MVSVSSLSFRRRGHFTQGIHVPDDALPGSLKKTFSANVKFQPPALYGLSMVENYVVLDEKQRVSASNYFCPIY